MCIQLVKNHNYTTVTQCLYDSKQFTMLFGWKVSGRYRVKKAGALCEFYVSFTSNLS